VLSFVSIRIRVLFLPHSLSKYPKHAALFGGRRYGVEGLAGVSYAYMNLGEA
jgi:hypothetical protein